LGDGTFLKSWGSRGSDDGQFRSIHGIAIDASGNVYVADTGNDRIQVFSDSTDNGITQETASQSPSSSSSSGSGGFPNIEDDSKLTQSDELLIPDWIKENAGWWASGQIEDSDFVSGTQWLITNGVMKISSVSQVTSDSVEIPDWVKNNAGWWAEGRITDSDFIYGIEWLITKGVMKIGNL